MIDFIFVNVAWTSIGKGGVGARTPTPRCWVIAFGYTWFKTFSISVPTNTMVSLYWVINNTYLLITSACSTDPTRVGRHSHSARSTFSDRCSQGLFKSFVELCPVYPSNI